jgi:glycosyltransferase involved in cell wall biosynthesis
VRWGREALRVLSPDIVHQQLWQNLWWMMDASTGLNIPTVYTAHDYGIGCLRTVLVTGRDELCDGRVGVLKCSRCILEGRNWLGRANELVAQLPGAATVLDAGYGAKADGPLARRGAERLPVQTRLRLTIERCERIFPKLRRLIAASPFSAAFFQQFGVAQARLKVLPWFTDCADIVLPEPGQAEALRIAFASRISPEKGLHVLLEAVERIKPTRPVELRIAGLVSDGYPEALRRRYPDRAGACRVEWTGWLSREQLGAFYEGVDVAVVPSLCYDNTPAALVEALAFRRPVVCTDVPSMTHLVREGSDGAVFRMGDARELAAKLQAFVDDPSMVSQYARAIRPVLSVDDYAAQIRSVYADISDGAVTG